VKHYVQGVWPEAVALGEKRMRRAEHHFVTRGARGIGRNRYGIHHALSRP
jgi:hypothetical protein